MFKKWLAVLVAVVLVASTVQLLWAIGGGGPIEEHPWGNNNDGGGTGNSRGTTDNPPATYPLTRIYIVRPAPMGGFYLMRINLPSNGSAKAAAGGKKVEN